jgi:hypothetical protein
LIKGGEAFIVSAALVFFLFPEIPTSRIGGIANAIPPIFYLCYAYEAAVAAAGVSEAIHGVIRAII